MRPCWTGATRLHHQNRPAWEGADAFFPDLDAGPDWEMAEEEEPQEHAGIPFRYVTYRRRKPHVCG